jgi:hypothetical protein
MALFVSKRNIASLLFIAGLTSAAHARVTAIGANGRPISTTYAQLYQTMKANGLTRARVDVNLAWDAAPAAVSKFQEQLNAAKANNITLEAILHTGFDWGDRTDHGLYPKGDATALYNQGYNRARAFVAQFANDVIDWELSNEVNLRNLDSTGHRLYGKGMTAAEFNTPLMNDWANVLKGMSDAIESVNAGRSRKLRRIVGTTGSMFGYIDFMRSKGVKVDVLGYHYYEHTGVNPRSYWLLNSSGFDLFAKMASYGLPVDVNEMDCAEIYDTTYVNQPGSVTMQKCNSNLAAMLNTWTTQTTANIESILLYEFLDEPTKAAPENRFGLMFNISNAKPMLSTVAAKARPLKPSVSYPNPIVIRNKVAATIKPILANAPVSTYLGCSAALLPAGMKIDPASCTISGTPNVPVAGNYVPTIIIGASGTVAVISITIN